MSFLFVGPKGSFEVRWITYALLRDTVQHHLSEPVPALLRVSEALGAGTVTLPARQLRAEASAAQAALLERPAADLAVSERTLSVLAFRALPVATGSTQLVSSIGGVPFVDPNAKTLDDVFGNLLRNLLSVTEGASDGDVIEVRDL